MAQKEFVFEKTVYLGDTNAEGNTYFARYFEWQGMAREEMFRELIPDFLNFVNQKGIRIITVEASMQYKHQTTLFDEILIKVKPTNVKHCSFDLSFTYINKKTNQIVALGRQTISFSDLSGKLIPIPEELKERGKYYLDEIELMKLAIVKR